MSEFEIDGTKINDNDLILLEVKRALRGLSDFEEGAKSDLIPHKWTYHVYGDGIVERRCDDIHCTKSEEIKRGLTGSEINEYSKKIQEHPELFEKESGYCKSRTIRKAIDDGTCIPQRGIRVWG